MIAKEIMHSMRKMRGKKGYIAIKIDFEKAYDRINWDFINRRLLEFNLPTKLINIIMNGVRSVSYKVLWNENKLRSFSLTRGVRQGDPILSYLFVICMDKLSQYIEQEVGKGNWNPIRVGRDRPEVSHLMFGNDLLLFTEAFPHQISNIKEILRLFHQAAAQPVARSSDSPLWKELVKLWPTYKENTICIIGNGLSTNFWLDPWVEGTANLLSETMQNITDLESTIWEWTDNEENWDNNKLRRFLPEEVVHKIIATLPPAEEYGDDRIEHLEQTMEMGRPTKGQDFHVASHARQNPYQPEKS
ncbi:hypothetical protein AHAS_Ahas20G0111700 [Arachis hypogaea]